MIHCLASVKPWLGKKSPRLGPKPSKPWNFFHDFLFPSTEIIVMQCILSVESFSWGTNCHPSMIGNYRKSEIRGCVVSQSLKHSALFAHLMFVYTFHMLSHLSKVFTVNFIKHRTLWLILNRAGQFFLYIKITFIGVRYDQNEPPRLGPASYCSNLELPRELQFFRQKINFFE